MIEEEVVIEECNTLMIYQEITADEEIDSDLGDNPALQDDSRPERSLSLIGQNSSSSSYAQSQAKETKAQNSLKNIWLMLTKSGQSSQEERFLDEQIIILV